MNELLHAHVTRVGFDLTLGHTHVAALVALDQRLRFRSGFRRNPSGVKDSWSAAISGLIHRGLVEHDRDKKRTITDLSDPRAWRETWRITPAGKLVIGLLKEAGLYEKYAPLVERVKKTA